MIEFEVLGKKDTRSGFGEGLSELSYSPVWILRIRGRSSDGPATDDR